MNRTRVVVTGLGALTPLGMNVSETWDGLVAGRSGVGRITRFDTSRHKVTFAAEIPNWDPLQHFDRKEARRYEPFVQYALVATKEALADSGIDLDKADRNEVGTIIGSGIGGLGMMEEQQSILLEKGPERVSPLLIPKLIANMAPGQASINFGLRGPNNCCVTACASGTNAIGDAANLIRLGYAKVMVAGGTEAAITPLGIAGFMNMKALSERNDDPSRASRPFSADRDGFVMGEGAGILVLEDLEYAKARGARIYAEIVGYGLTADAHHITAPAPEGEGAQRAMAMAIRDAGLKPSDVDHINAHGTSTPLNDKLETFAIRKVFGDHASKLAVSSNKSMVGHLLGAAGGVEAVASILAIKNGVVPPTINYSVPDPECDLDYVTEGARKMTVNAVLSNSFGFGGHNATVLFKRYED